MFDDPKARYFATANFYRRYAIMPDASPDAVWPLAGYSAKEPALVESRFGDGLVLLAGVSGHRAMVQPAAETRVRAAALADGEPRGAEGRAGRALGDAARRSGRNHRGRRWNPVTAVVTDPAGHGGDVAFQPVGTRLVGGFERTTLAGYYRVEVQGGTRPSEERQIGVRRDLAPEESRLAAAGEDDIRRWLPGVSLRVVDASAEARAAVRLRRRRHGESRRTCWPSPSP